MINSCQYHEATETYVCGYDKDKKTNQTFLNLAEQVYQLIINHTFHTTDTGLQPIEFKIDPIAVLVTEGIYAPALSLKIYNKKVLPTLQTSAVGQYVNDNTDWYYAGWMEREEFFARHTWLTDNIAISYRSAISFVQKNMNKSKGRKKSPKRKNFSFDMSLEELAGLAIPY